MPTKVKISSLNRRVTLSRITATDDGMGGSTDTETVLFETWANVTQTSGKTLLLTGQDVTQSLFTIIMRAATDRMPKINDFLTYEDMRLKIIGQPKYNDEGTRKFLTFTAQTDKTRG